MPVPEFKPGFRLSGLDVAALTLGSVGAIVLSTLDRRAGLAVATVVCHFFLFCNVFRISRVLELVWSTVFLAFTAGTIIWQVPGWITTLAVALSTTVLAVALEMRKPSYHGVAWRRINPGLRDWWESYIRDIYKG